MVYDNSGLGVLVEVAHPTHRPIAVPLRRNHARYFHYHILYIHCFHHTPFILFAVNATDGEQAAATYKDGGSIALTPITSRDGEACNHTLTGDAGSSQKSAFVLQPLPLPP